MRAQAAGPPTSGLSASSTDGLNPDQLREHSAAREAQMAGRHSPTFTEEFERRRLAGRHSPSFSEEFERRLEEDQVQAEGDRRLLQQLNSPATMTPAAADDEPAAEQQRPHEPAAEQPAPEPAAEHRRPPDDHLLATMGPPEAEGSWAARFDPDQTDAQMFPAGDDDDEDDDEDDDADPPPTLVASPPVEPPSPQMPSSSPRMLSPSVPPTDPWEKCDPWTLYPQYESAERADRRRVDAAHGPTPTIPPPATPLPPPLLRRHLRLHPTSRQPCKPSPGSSTTCGANPPLLQWTVGKTTR